ncbi:MAG: hypothetical protein IT389_08890 [Nitrospira sp.]|nr:hypothetical protein [Nitrospira sp.]
MIATISARTTVIALCGLLLGVPVGWAQSPPARIAAVDMQAGQSYRAGTRVRAPNGAASFLIPTGWRGEQLDNLAAVLLVSEKEAGFVLAFAILNQTEDELFALLGEPQPISETVVFEPTGPVTRKGSILTAAYLAGSLAGRGLAVMGPDLQGIIFLHARPQKEPWGVPSLLDQLADQVQFTSSTGSSLTP